jgi:hypothetical protein
MPLATGKSASAFHHNVAAEIRAGKPTPQAVAIAYAQKKRSDDSTLGETQTMPDQDDSELDPITMEKFQSCCELADSLSTRLSQLERKDAIRNIRR